MAEIPRLILDKKRKPPFSFILLTGDTWQDYYLYKENELEEAIHQLKVEFAKGEELAHICVPRFCNYDRTYRVKEFMKLDMDGRVVFEEFGETHLHIAFYTNRGLWLNERSDMESKW